MNDRFLTHTEFSRAVERLKAGAREDPGKSDLIMDGVIQRFEFTFELGWKLLKAILHHQGLERASPRSCIKEAFRIGVIGDGDAWIEMLEDRNRTAHLYDETEARAVFDKIRDRYAGLLSALESRAKELLSS